MIEIRGLRAQDHAAWLPLWQGYQRFYKVDIPAEVGETAWRRMLDEAEPMWGALALADGQALGLAHYVRHRTTWAVGDCCYLNDLYVCREKILMLMSACAVELVYKSCTWEGSSFHQRQ